MIETFNTFADGWLDEVWKASWQGAIALAVVWCVCRFVPRISPACKVWLWRLAWMKILLTLFWSGSIELPLERVDRGEPPGTQVARAPRTLGNVGREVRGDLATEHEWPSGAAILCVIWLAGMLAGAARLGWQWRQSSGLKRAAVALDNGGIAELCVRMRVRAPELRQSDRVFAPLLVGVFRPAVIVPANVCEEELRMMLAHELAHLKRRDLLWGWLPALCHTIFFFHPLLWLTRREWLLAQEMACDELALQHGGGSPAVYGHMLVDLVAAKMPHAGFGTLGICETPQNLKRRIIGMKTSGRKNNGLMVAVIVASAIGVLPWRIVAQDKREDAARRIQQLEKENAELRRALENSRGSDDQSALMPQIVAAEVALAGLQVEYAEQHPKVVAARARLKKLREIQDAERSRNVANKERLARERELYMEELALAQKHAHSIQKQRESGVVGLEELIRAQRQVFEIQREIAKLENDKGRLKQIVQEEIHAVQRLVKEAQKRVEIGIAPAGHDLELQREMLKLQRELLSLE